MEKYSGIHWTNAIEDGENKELEWTPEMGRVTWEHVVKEFDRLNVSIDPNEEGWRLPTRGEIMQKFKGRNNGYYWSGSIGRKFFAGDPLIANLHMMGQKDLAEKIASIGGGFISAASDSEGTLSTDIDIPTSKYNAVFVRNKKSTD